MTAQLALFDDAAAAVFRHPHAARELLLDGHAVGYALRRSRRRSIGFVVGADGLVVSAPRWVGIGAVEAAIRAKAGWVVKKLHEQRERARRLDAARIDWRDGAVLPFLGAPVTLRLDARAAAAVLDAGRAELRLPLPAAATREQVRDAAQAWLQRQARRVFDERCRHYEPLLGVRVRRLGLSNAATRWGSASADGSVRLNWRLVHMAPAVIDYVVAHELAHLREMHHGPAFWDAVRAVLPDYEDSRGALRQAALPSSE